MSAERPAFVDTNVLIYSVDGDDPGKREITLALIADLTATDRLRLSTQVLQAFFVTGTRKLRPPLSPHQALDHMDDLGLTQWRRDAVHRRSERRADDPGGEGGESVPGRMNCGARLRTRSVSPRSSRSRGRA